MDRVRTANELANPAYAQGTVAFVADRMRIMAASLNGSYQDAVLGNVRSISAADTVLKTDGLIILTGTGTYTLNLPAASTMSGSTVKFKKTGASGTITLDGNASETIDGATTYAITAQYRSVEIYSDGTNWHVLYAATPAAG